jgi:hypothetical protein
MIVEIILAAQTCPAGWRPRSHSPQVSAKREPAAGLQRASPGRSIRP